jgi:hypothetical protein
MVGTTAGFYTYAASNPLLYTDIDGLDVFHCHAPADLASGTGFGREHHWIMTGPAQSFSDPEFDAFMHPAWGWGPAGSGGLVQALVDHSRRTRRTCDLVPDVDEGVVNALLKLHRGTESAPKPIDGKWVPFVSDCRSFANLMLNSSGMSISGVARTAGDSPTGPDSAYYLCYANPGLCGMMPRWMQELFNYEPKSP